MLRVTPISTRQHGRCLKVEGRLVGAWVQVLRVEIEQSRVQDVELEVDLAGVEFADSEALSLLLEVAERGVKLVDCSPLLTSLLESKAS